MDSYNLSKTRAKRKLTQAKLAAISGVSKVTISKLENNHCKPQPITREKLESVLGPVNFKKNNQ